jgi:predicted nuclease of restriction endonuclease-like RecB superfamily
MIYTEEDDEFSRIEHENAMKTGQPYCFDVYVSPSQRNQVLEEVAKKLSVLPYGVTSAIFADFVRNLKK